MRPLSSVDKHVRLHASWFKKSLLAHVTFIWTQVDTADKRLLWLCTCTRHTFLLSNFPFHALHTCIICLCGTIPCTAGNTEHNTTFPTNVSRTCTTSSRNTNVILQVGKPKDAFQANIALVWCLTRMYISMIGKPAAVWEYFVTKTAYITFLSRMGLHMCC
jgi:hypothetical protein